MDSQNTNDTNIKTLMTRIKMKNKVKLLYEKLSYKARGAMIEVHKVLGSGHKESVYHRALAEEFKKQDIDFYEEKPIDI